MSSSRGSSPRWCLPAEASAAPPALPPPDVSALSRLSERYGTLSLASTRCGPQQDAAPLTVAEPEEAAQPEESAAKAEGGGWGKTLQALGSAKISDDPALKPRKMMEELVNGVRSKPTGKQMWKILRLITWSDPPLRLLLVSDNLPGHDVIMDAANANVEVIEVKYSTWTLDDLLGAIRERAAGRMFTTIGLFDHGKTGEGRARPSSARARPWPCDPPRATRRVRGGAGEFCLLKSLAGGSVDISDFKPGAPDVDKVEHFFKELCSYVTKPPPHIPPRLSKVYRVDILACSVAAGEGMQVGACSLLPAPCSLHRRRGRGHAGGGDHRCVTAA